MSSSYWFCRNSFFLSFFLSSFLSNFQLEDGSEKTAEPVRFKFLHKVPLLGAQAGKDFGGDSMFRLATRGRQVKVQNLLLRLNHWTEFHEIFTVGSSHKGPRYIIRFSRSDVWFGHQGGATRKYKNCDFTPTTGRNFTKFLSWVPLTRGNGMSYDLS